MAPRHSDRVASLVNCAVAGAVIFLLFWLLLPAFHTARRGRMSPCRRNLHNIGIALHNYHDAFESFPPAYATNRRGTPIHSWRVFTLPQIGQATLFNQYDFGESWNGPANTALAQSVGFLEVYECPSDKEERDSEQPWTSYVAIVGPHTAWPGERPARIQHFTDGTSNSFLVVESHNSGIHWMEPRDLRVAEMSPTINPASGQGISSVHDGGCFALTADGAVYFLSGRTDAETLRRLREIDDGEIVGDF